MVNICPIPQNDLAAFLPLTYPRYRALLAEAEPQVVAIGAYDQQQQAIGLAVASQQQRSAEVLSLFVAPAYRRQGIGRQLLNALETNLRQQACDQLHLVYSQTDQPSPMLGLLNQEQWPTPEARMLIFKLDVLRMAQAAWVQRQYRLPKNSSIVAWQDADPVALTWLTTQQTARWFPPGLSPFELEQPFDPSHSLVFCQDQQILGWVMTHLIDPQTRVYTQFYVHPDLRQTGIALALLTTALRHQAAQAEQWGMAAIRHDSAMMRNFLDRHFSDYLVSLRSTWGASKILASTTD
ncbi:MAG TPA: N-acetyltransferase [Herpetosiphon sp.]|uniref:GCN5-related N-acetyltransferase n=1 Tax=Herpetosiphon aurantiacus (strain ATCC 23779 / DSM 785 / 114-95) TaxID=316274 RepID=A9B7Y2_HERA2|nr:GNAT family N-acetyltransferase [Herpetosiphon sp.]ABX04510.1 GCN5-related N-acetyltransferase [Herpetosiphon aurantiacus DSM 785]HBW49891.1 N-acetyltransferase [Herpetosiphon sp.]